MFPLCFAYVFILFTIKIRNIRFSIKSFYKFIYNPSLCLLVARRYARVGALAATSPADLRARHLCIVVERAAMLLSLTGAVQRQGPALPGPTSSDQVEGQKKVLGAR